MNVLEMVAISERNVSDRRNAIKYAASTRAAPFEWHIADMKASKTNRKDRKKRVFNSTCSTLAQFVWLHRGAAQCQR